MDVYAATMTLLVMSGVILALILTRIEADAVLLTGLGVLFVGGVIPGKEAFAGFANEGMLTVGALFVVAAGLRQTGAVSRMAKLLLGHTQSLTVALARMVFPVAGASAFLNNTPIVAALLPAVTEWARNNRLPASRLLMPLSFATILGGTITVIGTSTNLVVTGLIEKNLEAHPGLRTVGIFDIAGVGLPVALVGCLLLVALAPHLLPDRRPAISKGDDPREYTLELLVEEGSPLVGSTIEQAGLRNLPNGYLIEIDRNEQVLPAVEPSTRLAAGDRLIFAGSRQSVVDLGRLPGLVRAPDQLFKLSSPGKERCLFEAVVAPSNPLVGKSIKDGGFRGVFNAVVVALARDGERVPGKLGEIVLRVGDVLLLEAHPSWVTGQRSRKDFYLVSEVEDSAEFRHERSGLALVILLLMVGAAATELTTMFKASLVAAGAMVVFGCCSGGEARRAIDWPVLVSIAAAFGIGEGIRLSGADALLAGTLIGFGAETPMASMVAMYIATALLTELITNNAAAALMFPFGLSLAEQLGVSPMPYAVAIMFAASASFITPIGYQTNMMVYGPGGYRFGDFFRMGLPIQITAGVVTCLLVPHFFPF